MSVIIKPIAPVKKSLKQYVHFGIDLYKGNKYFVPPLVLDEINMLMPEKNPAFDFCLAQSYMAYRDGKPVGRITGIINSRANEKFAEKTLRFGLVDFIDDDEVVDALFRAVQLWGHNHGMTKIAGPMGFTDMDREGMLVEGFEYTIIRIMCARWNASDLPRKPTGLNIALKSRSRYPNAMHASPTSCHASLTLGHCS